MMMCTMTTLLLLVLFFFSIMDDFGADWRWNSQGIGVRGRLGCMWNAVEIFFAPSF